MSLIFNTARLICLPPREEDLEGIFALYADPEIAALSSLAVQTNIDETRKSLHAWRGHWQAHGFGPWVIALQDARHQLIGCGGVSLRDFDGSTLPNLWYRFAPATWGKGYASEFALAALGQFRELSDYRELHALVLANNLASIRILEKLGMRENGNLANHDGASVSKRYCLRW